MSKKINHAFEIERLKDYKDYKQIYNDWYFQEFFVKRYMWDLPLASFELFGSPLNYQQILLWETFLRGGGWKGGMSAFASGHGTGKDFTIGRIVSLFLLTHYKSITRIVAPTLTQVTSSNFKEIENALNGLKEQRKLSDGRLITPVWHFLYDFIQINKEKIYIKGYEKNWYIEARTAPKGSSTNLSGQHQYSYLLILNEASGIEDEHIEAGVGALTEEMNSCIMLSQHTRLSGKFHEAMTTNSVDFGGSFTTMVMDGEKSPNVSKKSLKNFKSTYTDDEYRVRVKGQPPKKETGMLISPLEAHKAYENKCIEHYDSVVFSFDIGYSGYRDSSILATALTYTEIDKITDKTRTYRNVVSIKKYNGINGMQPVDFTTKTVFNEIINFLHSQAEKGTTFENVYVIGDATAGGYEACEKLEEKLLEAIDQEIHFKKLQWGSEKLYFEDKKRFINARAKGFVLLRSEIEEGRFCISTQNEASAVKRQLSNIPYKFTAKFQYQILSKSEMAKKNISSPDIGDTLAQLLLVQHIATYEQVKSTHYNEDDLVEIEDEPQNETNEEEKEDFEIQTIGGWEDEF